MTYLQSLRQVTVLEFARRVCDEPRLGHRRLGLL